eukprot:TRINITY_DN3603_c0_g2_i1.p1 TRINITY_DN3603_c0_g2~~TRINITY_DN3603_c0_g2_i1.p1  ORF type:complete len:267 (+),score=47.17 TRINITY_DN3603_c0_g2_i1:70-870(+)
MEMINCPHISAKSWAVFDSKSGQLLKGKGEHTRREVASLTKIMTAYTVLELANRLLINIKKHVITIDSKSALTMGTTAGFLQGEEVTVYDVLHALLLPSGNDAGSALACHFGNIIQMNSKPHMDIDSIKIFIEMMNRNAKKLLLKNTSFSNPHGLSDPKNYSTAYDIGLLTFECMKSKTFAEIVGKLKYTCCGLAASGAPKNFEWCQTNRLLWRGFSGVKTGTTQTAGKCLCATHTQASLIIVVLDCKSEYHRWQDAVALKSFFTK